MKRVVSLLLIVLTLVSTLVLPLYTSADSEYIHPSFEKACDTIRYYILQWKKDPNFNNPYNVNFDFYFTVKYKADHVNTASMTDDVIKEVFKYTGDYYKGDSLYNFLQHFYVDTEVKSVEDGYVITLNVYGNYRVSRSQIQQINKWVDTNAVWLATKKYNTGTSEYGKALGIYRWIISNCKKDDVNNPKTTSHTAYAAKYGVGVCDGFAHLYYMMAVRCGLKCRMIVRHYKGGGHCWCVVQINSKWYFVDPMKGGLSSSSMKKYFLSGTNNYDSSYRRYNKNDISDDFCGWLLADRYFIPTDAVNTNTVPDLITIEKYNYK